ncbi:acyl-homoserine-lactone synthase [Komagataeibacter diospyri]|uniref:Acyl-homoserine-lactone synthase n=1 Tax=Komagataeibacter diospyri TaxID=1932662 RepID=A0A4P5NYW9_9PROT|nr:acyl-homoserine-lactone synthase [Komagataeibacter diospyri]GCE85171.1 N-acyl-L-homoserine lactone synthetase [Komagataeibacter diospyri]
MIEVVTVENAYGGGTALVEQFKFRYRHFVANEQWEVPFYNGMEYDQFDTPAAVYLVWRDAAGIVRGMIRLLPTSRPYMLETLWPDMLPNPAMPSGPAVWEITRFGVERTLSLTLRKKISAELILACIEFSVLNGIHTYLFLTAWGVLKRIVPGAGVEAHIHSRKTLSSGHDVASAVVPVSQDVLDKARAKLNINYAVLHNDGFERQHAA